MAKPKTRYHCTECGAHSPKWAGQCGDCGAWNTLTEQTVRAETGSPASRFGGFAPVAEARKLDSNRCIRGQPLVQRQHGV